MMSPLVTDSVGQSVPGMAAQGKAFAPEEAERYAHAQALFQTPWELVGDVAVANVDQLFADAEVLESGPDRAGDKNLKAIHRFYAPMIHEGEVLAVRITVKESANPATAIEFTPWRQSILKK